MNPLRERRLLVDRSPPEFVLHDVDDDACPYLPGRTARMPMRLPIRQLQLDEFDERLQRGDRRHGVILYAPTCPSCCACEPIRIPVHQFQPHKTHRRIQRRNGQLFHVELGEPTVTRERVDLYEKHLAGRNLRSPAHAVMTPARYRGFIADSCCETFEIRMFHEHRLVLLAVTDRGARSLSAHYTFFDPDLAHLSMGTYAILTQVRLAREWGLDYLYLGLFIQSCNKMVYKAGFRPHERRIAGSWRTFA
ncbi:MAG: arginyltransferase [Polyangiaceae bacterium]|nr:arginyltransferase [Polyangiaceae bacterium]